MADDGPIIVYMERNEKNHKYKGPKCDWEENLIFDGPKVEIGKEYVLKWEGTLTYYAKVLQRFETLKEKKEFDIQKKTKKRGLNQDEVHSKKNKKACDQPEKNTKKVTTKLKSKSDDKQQQSNNNVTVGNEENIDTSNKIAEKSTDILYTDPEVVFSSLREKAKKNNILWAPPENQSASISLPVEVKEKNCNCMKDVRKVIAEFETNLDKKIQNINDVNREILNKLDQVTQNQIIAYNSIFEGVQTIVSFTTPTTTPAPTTTATTQFSANASQVLQSQSDLEVEDFSVSIEGAENNTITEVTPTVVDLSNQINSHIKNIVFAAGYGEQELKKIVKVYTKVKLNRHLMGCQLLKIFYTKEEMGATWFETRDKKKEFVDLDPIRLALIKKLIFFKFPVESENEGNVWDKVIIKIRERCRSCRQKP